MSVVGQSRHFGCVPITSGLPSTPDMFLHCSNRSFVPIAYIRLLAVLLTYKQIVEPAKDSAADQAVNQR